MSISASTSGGWDDTEAWLKKMAQGPSVYDSLSRFGAMGVAALAAATPKDEGVTAGAWYFEVKKDATSWSLIWGNNNVVDGKPIAVLIEYGHGTRTGGYVPGRPFVNAALDPIFDQMSAEGWKVVTQS